MNRAIWDFLNQIAYWKLREKLIKQTLKDRIITLWEKISIEEIRKSVSVWKKPLCIVVNEDTSHIKHRLKRIKLALLLYFLTRSV